MYDPQSTRAALVRAAIELFGERGFHATSVQELVDAAGLTKGAFYHHFDSKEAVLHVIHDEFVDLHLSYQRSVLERYETAHDQLFNLICELVALVGAYQPSVEVFFQERKTLRGEHHDQVLAKREAAMATWRDLVRRGVEDGEFHPDLDPDVTALGIVGMCVWTYQWYRPTGPRSPEEIGRNFALMTLRGLSAKPEIVDALAVG